MPLHLHFADPPKAKPRMAPTPQPQASDLRVALGTIATSLAVIVVDIVVDVGIFPDLSERP